MVHLVKREYWKRVWIIQEIFRARKIAIHCGTSELPWACLARFFRRLSDDYLLLHLPRQIALLRLSLPAKLTKH
jgi:hypothetical protein